MLVCGVATYASPTAQQCDDYLDLEGEKKALALVDPHIDVIWLDDVTPVKVVMEIPGTQCKCKITLEAVHEAAVPNALTVPAAISG